MGLTRAATTPGSRTPAPAVNHRRSSRSTDSIHSSNGKGGSPDGD
ncbi:hypothetical protein NOGI109294_16305 [Nocardiopsis gilva]